MAVRFPTRLCSFWVPRSYFQSRRRVLPLWAPIAALTLLPIVAYGVPLLYRGAFFMDCLLVFTALLMTPILVSSTPLLVPHRSLAALIDFLARISYPLFLVHWACGAVVFRFTGMNNAAFFTVGLGASIVVASLLVFAVDRPVEVLRARIRSGRRVSESSLADAAVGASGIR